jgi:magnesium-protoporphyrin IX monomethyl ester (oxidative) cyclase
MYMMKEAGIGWIQPGLESLSDETLRLMRKGTTQIQNTQTLKWGEEAGIFISWNWLFGFPGESEQELETLREVARSVHHLQPPQAAPVLYLERFSPYHNTPEEWNLEPIWPSPAYGHVYPFSRESLDRIAFFFDCDFLQAKEKGAAFSSLSKVVKEWQKAFPYSHLLMFPAAGSLVIVDTRRGARKLVRRLRGLERDVYEFCWKMRSPQELERGFEGRAEEGELERILQTFVDDGLLMYNASRYLSLAVDPRVHYRDYPVVFPGGQFLFPSERRAERRRWIVDGLLLRRPLGETVTELARRARISVTRLAVRTLIRLLPDAEGPEKPTAIKPASQAA